MSKRTPLREIEDIVLRQQFKAGRDPGKEVSSEAVTWAVVGRVAELHERIAKRVEKESQGQNWSWDEKYARATELMALMVRTTV